MCCWVPTVASSVFGCCRKLSCCEGQVRKPTPPATACDDDRASLTAKYKGTITCAKYQRMGLCVTVHSSSEPWCNRTCGYCTLAPTPPPTPTAPACVDQHSTCGSLHAGLVAKGYGCAADLGKVFNNVSLSGRRLADECCASCGGDSDSVACIHSVRCETCIAGLNATAAECASYGFDCSCSSSCIRQPACTKCMHNGHSATQCAAVGIECKCSRSAQAPTRARRKAFGVASSAAVSVSVSVATNVDGGTSSARRAPLVTIAMPHQSVFVPPH